MYVHTAIIAQNIAILKDFRNYPEVYEGNQATSMKEHGWLLPTC